MYKRARRIFVGFHTYKGTAFFVAAIVFGLLFGTIFAGFSGSLLHSVFREATRGQATYFGLLIVVLAPFVLLFLGVYLGIQKLTLLICFIHAFRIAFITMACYGAFGAGSWLLRLLFQFSDLILFPVFCWAALRNVCCEGKAVRTDALICATAVVITTGIDFCFVSPFLAMLINY